MRTRKRRRISLIARWFLSVFGLSPVLGLGLIVPAATRGGEPLEVSGRYPHLALFNHGGECGIGAVVPWAGRLWGVTYSPHSPRGSDDKLFEIDESLTMVIRPEGIGGTPANRLIHRESNQLFIGPYVIDSSGGVRVIPYEQAVGRPTATMRHLTDPAKKVYTFTMEEGLYEIDVETLAVKTLFTDSVLPGFVDYLPGYHGKGGFTGQGRIAVSNNGGQAGKPGCLAEWDGKTWNIVDEHQFNEVSGPGGIRGNAGQADPIWATGWDKCSVLVKLLDGGRWSTYRLPIGSYCYTASHGWYTEWPRIRQVGPKGEYLMNMHGLWYDFPGGFSASDTARLRPIASYLKITADFCRWKDRVVFGCDDTAITGGNRFVNQSQSNLWFREWEKLAECGRPAGWGGVWVHDDVAAGATSLPFHFAGYGRRMIHLAHGSDQPVAITIEVDRQGDGRWSPYETISVPAGGYQYHVFPDDLKAEWVRLQTDRAASDLTAYFHFSPGGGSVADSAMFASLAGADDGGPQSAGIVRPRGGDLGTLQVLAHRTSEQGDARTAPAYYEVGPEMGFQTPADHAEQVEFLEKNAGLGEADFTIDAASAAIVSDKVTYRLPISDDAYREAWSVGWPRGVREVVTERMLLNCAGTFYVLPHKSAGGYSGLKPVCTHNKRITDFCSWRGMLVLAGTRADAKPDGHYFASADGSAGLWFGDVDDLWKLGKPRGRGGPWLNTPVEAGKPSDPYLMTGFDEKTISLSHDSPSEVTIRIEVDFLRDGTWKTYQSIPIPPGQTITHKFPAGYSAHWVRFVADRASNVTAQLTYE